MSKDNTSSTEDRDALLARLAELELEIAREEELLLLYDAELEEALAMEAEAAVLEEIPQE